MLDFFRRGAKSWVAKGLIVLLIASFAVWGIGDVFSFRLDTPVAEVGESEVSADAYANAVSRQQALLSQQARRLISFEDIRTAGVDRQILQSMVAETAISEELRVLGLDAPDDAVVRSIQENPSFQGAGGFSEAAYRLALSQQRLTPAEYEALARDDIARSILRDAVSGTPTPPPMVGQRIAEWNGEQRSFELLTLPLEAAEEPPAPDDSTLQSFVDENAGLFTEPERRSGQYLYVDPARLAESRQPDEDALRAAYEADIDLYRVEASRVIDQITFPDMAAASAASARLEGGEITFDTLAEELGQAGPGLSLGKVAQGDLPVATDAAVFALTEPGVTPAVQTPVGGAILRVHEATEETTAPFEAVRDAIALSQAQEAGLDAAIDVANQVEELRAGGQSFTDIAAATEAVNGRFEGLAANGTLAGGEPAQGVVARPEFQGDVFAALSGEEREILELADGGFLLVMVEQVAESHVPALNDIRDDVAEAWRRDARRQALTERAERLQPKLEAGEITLQSVAAGMRAQVRQAGPFLRAGQSEEVPREILQAAFAAGEGAIVHGPVTDGVLIARISSVEPMAEAERDERAGRIDQVFAQSIAQDQVDYFTRELERTHGAFIDPGAIDEVFRLLSGVGHGYGN